jgi:integrase
MKASKEHRVPLSSRALAILRDNNDDVRTSEYLFPGGKAGRPLSNMAMTEVLRRMDRGDITVHGFRSTFRDWAAERTNFPNEVVEMALAHAVGNKSSVQAWRFIREAPPADGRVGDILQHAGRDRTRQKGIPMRRSR